MSLCFCGSVSCCLGVPLSRYLHVFVSLHFCVFPSLWLFVSVSLCPSDAVSLCVHVSVFPSPAFGAFPLPYVVLEFPFLIPSFPFWAQCSILVCALGRMAFARSLEGHLANARSCRFVKWASDFTFAFSKMDFFWVRNVYRDMGQGLCHAESAYYLALWDDNNRLR